MPLKKLKLKSMNGICAKLRDNGTHEYQYCNFGPRSIDGYGAGAAMTVLVSFDDSCRNGHDGFAITADVRVPKRRDVEACGCLHEDIARVFPELAYLIPWHLTSTDSPMHYSANAVYLAGDRDHWGLRKGEMSTNPRTEQHTVRFGTSPFEHKVSKRLRKFILDTIENGGEFILDQVGHTRDTKTYGSKFQFAGMDCVWHECPFNTERECRTWIDAITGCEMHWSSHNTVIGEGKARELDAARRAANWPDASDEILCAEPDVLKAALAERLPALQAAFREAMESVGFAFMPAATQAQ